MVEAYSHEVSSCGLWLGGGPFEGPTYYSYSYPEPEGFKEAQVEPAGAYYESSMGEFILPYEKVRKSQSPDESLLSFLQSTYEACSQNSQVGTYRFGKTLKFTFGILDRTVEKQ